MARGIRRRTIGQTQSVPPVGAITSLTKRHIHLNSGWNASMVAGQQANFEAKTHAITGYKGTPQWELHKGWNVESYNYLNVFLDPATVAPRQYDLDGADLWLPWGTPNVDARPSRDLKSETYRAQYTAECRATLADGGESIFCDDTNPDHPVMFRRWTGTAYAAPQRDFGVGAFYTSPITGQVGWAALLADFLTDVRARVLTGSDGGIAYPAAKFMLNTQWNILIPLRWTDPRLIRTVDAGDIILIAEHGFGDPNHAAGGFPGSDTGSTVFTRDLLKFVDMILGRGKRFCTFARGDGDRFEAHRYEMAVYLAKRSNLGGDMIGMWTEGDGIWPNIDEQFMADPGLRLTYNDNGTTISATFEAGSVSVIPGVRSSAVINLGPAAAALDQLAFAIRLDDTLGLNAPLASATVAAGLDQLAFQIRTADTAALNATFGVTASLDQLAFQIRPADTAALNATL